MRRRSIFLLAAAACLGAALPGARAEAATGAAPGADEPAEKLRGELAEAQRNLVQARKDAEELRNQLQAAQDDLLVRTRALATKVTQAQQAQAAAEAQLAARTAPKAPDPRLASLQNALADNQKMTIADQATIIGLKNDLATAQAALNALNARDHAAAPAADLRPAVVKLEADRRELLATNAKLEAQIKLLLAKPAAAPPAAAKDPRVDLHARDLQTALLAEQQQTAGDRKTITQLQAELTLAKSGAEMMPAQQQREALLKEIQTALAAAQLASRTDREALVRAQADLEATRTALALNQTNASALAQAKSDLATETTAAAQAQAVAGAAASQRDQSARDLADARAAAAALRTQLQEAEGKLAAFIPGPDLAHQLADAQGRVDLFKRRSADLAVQVDQLAAQNRRLTTALEAAKLPPAVVAAAPAGGSAIRWYVVLEGDSLTRISTRYYGTPTRWPEIYDANRDVLQGETAPVVGQRLRIP